MLLDDRESGILGTQPEEGRRREAEDRRRGPVMRFTADGMPIPFTEEELDPVKRAAKKRLGMLESRCQHASLLRRAAGDMGKVVVYEVSCLGAGASLPTSALEAPTVTEGRKASASQTMLDKWTDCEGTSPSPPAAMGRVNRPKNMISYYYYCNIYCGRAS